MLLEPSDCQRLEAKRQGFLAAEFFAPVCPCWRRAEAFSGALRPHCHLAPPVLVAFSAAISDFRLLLHWRQPSPASQSSIWRISGVFNAPGASVISALLLALPQTATFLPGIEAGLPLPLAGVGVFLWSFAPPPADPKGPHLTSLLLTSSLPRPCLSDPQSLVCALYKTISGEACH